VAVFVLDKNKQPLMPCSEKRARLLLERGRAVVVRVYPFVIRLKDRAGGDLQPLRVKLDPGSKVTGVAVVRDDEFVDALGRVWRDATVLKLINLEHRGAQISEKLTKRAALRRSRRNRKLRYRAPRLRNRARRKGWLPPSLQHRVDSIRSWVSRLRRWAPVSGISMELVRFDLQKRVNPEIAGVQYQQGTLEGYEVREYLLEKYDRRCVYCDATGVPLNIDHVVAVALGGSHRITNLVTACVKCNRDKGNLPIQVFLKDRPEFLAKITAQLQVPLKDATAVNATRWALFRALEATGLPVECSSGGCTKWNRTRSGISKTHALDAACVGRFQALEEWEVPAVGIRAAGRGAYCRTRVTASGFPRGYLPRKKGVRGFQTGDMVRACVPHGKKAGTHVGRVAVRTSGRFNIQMGTTVLEGIGSHHCIVIQRGDGYAYTQHALPPRPQGAGFPRGTIR